MEKEKITTLKFISSHDEAGNVRTFIFDTGGLEWLAGQSQGFIIESLGNDEEVSQRWFTISSAPSEKEIHVSTRVSDSAFKQALNNLKADDEIKTYGLGGDFVWEDSEKPLIFVAGGIGVTPFRSMIVERELKGENIPAVLLYFNRTNKVAFLKEFEDIAQKHPEFIFKNIVGESISTEKIIELTLPEAGQIVYISGPEKMVEAVSNDLKEKAKEVIIKKDHFPGYTELNY